MKTHSASYQMKGNNVRIQNLLSKKRSECLCRPASLLLCLSFSTSAMTIDLHERIWNFFFVILFCHATWIASWGEGIWLLVWIHTVPLYLSLYNKCLSFNFWMSYKNSQFKIRLKLFLFFIHLKKRPWQDFITVLVKVTDKLWQTTKKKPTVLRLFTWILG